MPTFRVVACHPRRPTCARRRCVRRKQVSKCYGRFKRGSSCRAGTGSLRAYQPQFRELSKPHPLRLRNRGTNAGEARPPLPILGGANGAVHLTTRRATSRGRTKERAAALRTPARHWGDLPVAAGVMVRQSQTRTSGYEGRNPSPPTDDDRARLRRLKSPS
jgi:hypothetical protein